MEEREGGLLQLPAQLGQDGPGAPAQMGPAHLDDPGLDLGGDLVGTAIRPGAAVRERPEALARVAPEPAMDRAAIDAVTGRHVGHLGAVEHLPHREGALLNHRQLREHLWFLLGSGEPK